MHRIHLLTILLSLAIEYNHSSDLYILYNFFIILYNSFEREMELFSHGKMLKLEVKIILGRVTDCAPDESTSRRETSVINREQER